MIYGYIRVSSTTQNLDRQINEMHELGLTDKQIFADKQSGKDFERANYQKLKKKLKNGDLLIVKSIDRLGRNYDMIIEEWKDIVNKNIDIKVLDMPLLDTRIENKNLVGKFISDVVLQVLSFVAENERNNIKQRQAEGIKIAKMKGKHLGRPKIILSKNFNEILNKYLSNKISLGQTLDILKMKKSTFYKYFKIYKNQLKST